MRYVRAIEVLVGLVFVVFAAGKAYDVAGFAFQVKSYGVLPDNPTLILWVAYATILLETALGAALMCGFRLGGITPSATIAVLVGFTGLIVYGWVFHDLEDCGCIGKLVKMGPLESIIKNIVLMGLLGVAWRGFHRHAPESGGEAHGASRRLATGLSLLLTVVLIGGAWASGNETVPLPENEDPGRPFAKFVFTPPEGKTDLGKGTYIVPVFNATCDHCRASVAVLNELLLTVPECPQVVALVDGSEEELEEFKLLTDPLFATFRIDTMTIHKMQLVDHAPPRFYRVEDGVPQQHIDEPDPTLETLMPLVTPSE